MFCCGYNKSSQIEKLLNNKDLNGYPCISPAVKFHGDTTSFYSISINCEQMVFITKKGKAYVRGDNSDGVISGSLPKTTFTEDTEFLLKDEEGHPCKFISVICGYWYTLYLVSDESGVSNFRLVYCYKDKTPNPLFLNIGNRTPRALFGGDDTSGVIDSEGGIIVITESVFDSPTEKILPTFLPHGDKAVKLAFCNGFVISLGESGRVYKSKISGSSPPKFSEVTELSGKTVVDVTGTDTHCFAVLNDGRVFGYGSNGNCRLGMPQGTPSVSKFTEIDSLKKHKIVSAFAGSLRSIFKTSEGKMIVCGHNNYGELFIPPKEIVYPPEEVKDFEGFTSCLVGYRVSAVFFGIDPPPNVGNKKISFTLDAIEKVKKSDSKNITKSSSSTEINDLKKNLSAKEEEISHLKEEISHLKEEISRVKTANARELKKKDDEISHLKEENCRLKSEINQLKRSAKQKDSKSIEESIQPIKVYTTTEIESFGEGKRIGKGSTSEVFEVVLKEKVAKKVLDAEIIQKEETETKIDDSDNDNDNDDNDDDDEQALKISIEDVKRLMQECEALNRLNHPNIVKTFGFYFGDKKHAPAILLEHCESNLKKRIKKLTNEERISAIVSLSSAMKKVHSVGIIHRDLKLENILLDAKNNVKLSDFGLCTFIKTDDETLSRTQMAGSLKFMSPELLQGRTDYDEKVDVYAFGVVVFLILTKGEYPNITFVDVATGKQAEIPNSITKFSSKLIKDCWSFKSSERPSFEEICDRLKGNEQKLI